MPRRAAGAKRLVARAWKRVRERPLLPTLFALLFVAQSVPVWITRVLPQGDIYQHLAIAEIIHNYDASGSIYAEHFLLPDFIKPNLLYYYVVHALGFVVPLEVANKLLLNLYVVLVPLSMLYLLTVFGRPRRLALFSFLFVFNSLFRTGYAGYLLSIPLYLFGIGLFYRLAVRPTWRRGVGTALLANLLFFTHAQMYLMYMLTAGVMALFLWDGPRRFFLRIAAPAASLLVFVPWFLRFVVFYEAEPSTFGLAGVDQGFGAAYHSPETLLSTMFARVMNNFRGSVDEIIALLAALLMAIGLVLRGHGEAPAESPPGAGDAPPRESRWNHRYLPEILTLLVMVSIFALPVHIKGQAVISVRHVPLAVILLITWLGWSRRRWTSAVFAIAVATLALFQAVYVSREHLRYERELDGYEQLFEEARPWSRLYKVSGTQLFSHVAHGNVFWHIHYNFMLWRGGITDVQFAEFVTCPVRYRPGMIPPKLPREPGKSPDWRYYDYFLVQRSELGRVRGLARWLRQVSENRGWVLYEKRNRPVVEWWDLDRMAPPEKLGRAADRKPPEAPAPDKPPAAAESVPRAPRTLPTDGPPRQKRTFEPISRK